MNLASDDINVVPIIREYRDVYMEQQSILTEIRNHRKKFEKRLKDLKSHMNELEKKLLLYMREHDHPGLRFQEIVLLQEDKTQRKNMKVHEEEMQSILHRHRIDPTDALYRELLDTVHNSKIPHGEKKLKLKIYKKNTD